MVLNAWDLLPVWTKNLEKKKKNEKNEYKKNIIKWIEYNSDLKEFYVLYDNEFVIETLKENEEQELFDSF